MWRYTRLVGYSPLSIQSLPKEQRKKLLIDGEPATELDYCEFDLRQLYNWHGIDISKETDAYKPEIILPKFYTSSKATEKNKQLIRKFIKTVTNICLNTKSERSAISAIKKKELDVHKKRPLLRRILHKVEDCYTSKELVQRIKSAHAEIASEFFKGVGASTMAIGAGMMIDILWELIAKRNIPAYGIHDAVLCRRSDRKLVRTVMRRKYRLYHAGFTPKIEKEY
jgi:hypothetical protein